MVLLADLLAHAGDGETVTVPAGLTPGSGPVRIAKAVNLVSFDGTEVCDDVVVVSGHTVTVSGLSFTGVLSASAGARLVVRHCRFTSRRGRPAVYADGTDCTLDLTSCRFTGGEANAVRLGGGAVARMTDCDFVFFESPAVVVTGPGTGVALTDCRFAGMTGHAVLAEDGGAARVAGCSFDRFLSDRWTAVIAVGSGGSVEVDRCRFAPMSVHGVYVRGEGRARLSDCSFEGCSESAAVSAQGRGSEVDVTDSRFAEVSGRGLEVAHGGTARVSGCDFQAVGVLAPIYAEGQDTSVRLTDCRIATANSVAAAVAGSAELAVADCGFDCPGGRGLADGTIGLGRDGSRLRVSGACSLRGATLEVAGAVDRSDPAAGATITLTTAHSVPCRECNATGGRPGTSLTACPRCGGRGRAVSCADCRGSGLRAEAVCAVCAGSGGQIRDRSLEIPVPAGVRPGQTLIAAGHGGPGLGSGVPGDLRIVVSGPEGRPTPTPGPEPLPPGADAEFRSVEEFFAKTLGVQVAEGSSGAVSGVDRRELDDAVRREAIRLGLLPPDSPDSPEAP